MATDGGLSGLMDELRAGGDVDSQGRFTLDHAQARAKMQKFQLVDARRYVLELVQAAVLRGATRIALEIDTDDLNMHFDGAPFTAAELDDLWGSIFADGDGVELRATRQLALGLNAALGLRPARIFVRSGDQELLLRPDRPEVLIKLEPPIAGTEIHVEQRLKLDLVLDFLRNIRGKLGEEVYLRERCCHAPIAITIGGASIVRGMHVEGAIVEQPIAAPGVNGVLALTSLRPRAPAAELRLVKDGVWIDSQPLEQCGPGVVAVVDAALLRKDVSLAKIVADDALAQIVGLVRAERWGLFARLVAASQPLEPPQRERVASEALQFLRPRDLRKRPEVAVVTGAIRWLDARSHPGGSRPEWVTLAELVELADSGDDSAPKSRVEPAALRHADRDFPLLSPQDPPIPRMSSAEAKQVARILGCAAASCTHELQQATNREVGRRAWLKREMPATLPTRQRYLVRAPLAGPDVRGEIGVAAAALLVSPLRESTLWLLRDSRLLATIAVEWGVPGFDAVVDGPLTPTEDYTDVVRDAALVGVVLQLLAGVLAPLTELATRAHGPTDAAATCGMVKAWLGLVLDPQLRERLWQRLGVPEPLRPGPDVVHAWLPTPSELRAGSTRLAVVSSLPLFEDFDGAPRSLADLLARHARAGGLDELDRAVAQVPGLGHEVAWLGRGDRAVLAAVLGADALRSWAPTLEIRQRQRTFAAAPKRTIAEVAQQVEADLHSAGLDPALWSRVINVGDIAAVIAMARDRDPKDRTTRVELLYHGGHLGTRTLEFGVGPMTATVPSTMLQARADWTDVEDDAALRGVLAALREGALTLMCVLVRHHARTPGAWPWLTAALLYRLGEPGGAELEQRVPELRMLPLLRTLDERALSLDELDALLTEHGRVAWVPTTTTRVDLDGPPMLREDPLVIAALRARLGAEPLVDGSARVRAHGHRRKLEDLPAVDRAEVDRSRVWFAAPITGVPDGVEGEIGLSRARTDGGLVLELCTAGRRIGVVAQPEFHAPVDAILADPELALDDEGAVDTRSKRHGLLLRRCRRAVPRLIVGLCERFVDLAADERALARTLLLGYLARSLAKDVQPGGDVEAARVAVRGLPLVTDVSGAARTLAEVQARAQARGFVEVVDAAAEAPPAPLERLIVRVDAAVRACLVELEVRDLSDRWPRELAAMRALASAPAFELPDLRAVAWVERKTTVAGGLKAHLWIPREPTDADAAALTIDGRVVGNISVLAALPCAGVVSGDGLVVGDDGPRLDGRQRSSLARQACILYEVLARQVKSGGRLNAEDRERALDWLLRAEERLAATDDRVLGSLGQPLDQLRATLAKLGSPALRKARAGAAKQQERARTPGPAERGTKPEQATQPRATTIPTTEPEATDKSAPQPRATDTDATPPDAAAIAAPQPEATVPGVTPASEPTPPPTPEQALIRIVRAELEWARARHGELLERLALDRLAIGTDARPGLALFDAGVVLQRRHPLVARALADLAAGRSVDPIDLTFMVSAIYTLMNAVTDDIGADDEQAFIHRLAQSLELALAGA